MTLTLILKIALCVVGAILAGCVLFHVLSWIFLGILTLFVNFKKDYSSTNKFWTWALNYGYFLILFEARVRIKYSGLEKLPLDQKYMIVSNHRSNFDNMIMSYVLRFQPLSFVSKKENFKIPLGRKLIKRNCYLCLNRGNIKSAIEVIRKGSELLKNNVTSIGVFPEGTRSKNGELLEFMPGCLKIATSAKCPLVISSVTGTENIHKNFPFKRTVVEFSILDVIPSDQVASMKTVELCERSYKVIKNKIESEK